MTDARGISSLAHPSPASPRFCLPPRCSAAWLVLHALLRLGGGGLFVCLVLMLCVWHNASARMPPPPPRPGNASTPVRPGGGGDGDGSGLGYGVGLGAGVSSPAPSQRHLFNSPALLSSQLCPTSASRLGLPSTRVGAGGLSLFSTPVRTDGSEAVGGRALGNNGLGELGTRLGSFFPTALGPGAQPSMGAGAGAGAGAG
ncbi:unnamed protein product, partial [Discosporangium mesarthrocarpum]